LRNNKIANFAKVMISGSFEWEVAKIGFYCVLYLQLFQCQLGLAAMGCYRCFMEVIIYILGVCKAWSHSFVMGQSKTPITGFFLGGSP
jgi:hypothetical protein